MFHKQTRQLLYRLAALICLAFPAWPAMTDKLDEVVSFSIPAQPMVSALIEFSKQADLQIMGSSTPMEGLRSSEVNGKLTVREGLIRLLRSTTLTYKSVRSAVVIESIVPPERQEPIDL